MGDRPGDAVADCLSTVSEQHGTVLHANSHTGSAMRGKYNNIVNRVVRSTKVPIAELSSPRMRSPSHWPGTARSATSAGCSLIMIYSTMKDLPRPGCAPVARATLAQCVGRQSTRGAKPVALHVKRLVVGFVADAHRLIVRKVVLQAVGNLLRAPRRCPTPIFARSMSATFPEHHRSGKRCSTWRNDHASQSILNISPQRRVQFQLCRLGAPSGPFSMPLRVAAFRRSSPEIVDPDRPIWRAILRTPAP